MGGQQKSFVSALSSEEASEYEDAEEGAQEGGKDKGEMRVKGRAVKCPKCDGRGFKAMLVGEEQRLCCVRCGTAVGG